MVELNKNLHWVLAACVAVVDVLIVALVVAMDRWHYRKPPEAGHIDTSAPLGWISAFGSIFIFGCYGFLLKAPSVQEAKCDCMVFQCYSSLAVVVVSMTIWLAAGSAGGLAIDGGSFSLGSLFGTLWIITQICAYHAVQSVGYAVGPAIWVGVTIIVSFLWGVIVFQNPVQNWFGAVLAMMLMIIGVCLAAGSSLISDRQARSRVVSDNVGEVGARPLLESGDESKFGAFIFGIFCATVLGVCNGSLMVPLSCFQHGCPAVGIQAYIGAVLAPVAFLPSLAAGTIAAHLVLFLMYWGPSMCRGEWPQFHVSTVALPALLTGGFWGLGNFTSFYATVYLGQVVGFPLTQCCLIICGLWGILYFREIQGCAAVGTFVAASAVILAGATLDGWSC